MMAMRMSSVYPNHSLWSSGAAIRKYSPNMLSTVKSSKSRKIAWSITCALRASPPLPLEVPSSPFLSDTKLRTAGGAQKGSEDCKGWLDDFGVPDQRLESQLEALEVSALDRSDVNAILCTQCDKWNLLLHTGVAITSVSAAIVSAMNATEHALGLSMLACLLGLVVSAFMTLMNMFQPSQVAEEHRHAARFFRRLTTDIRASLETEPALREQASLLWKHDLGIFRALDSQFPSLRGSPVHQKFPTSVQPSILSATKVDIATPEVETRSDEIINGWTTTTEKALKRTAELLRNSDVPNAVDQATTVFNLNQALARVSPLLALSGVVCNMVSAYSGIVCLSGWGSALTVGAFFAHSASHCLQLGAAYETYRNCAGYYAEIERSIEKTLRLPVQERGSNNFPRQNLVTAGSISRITNPSRSDESRNFVLNKNVRLRSRSSAFLFKTKTLDRVVTAKSNTENRLFLKQFARRTHSAKAINEG